MANEINQLYEQHIRSLSEAEQLRLVGQIVAGIARQREGASLRSILDLHGNGTEVWRDVDADAYVKELRSEWDQRP